MVAFVETGRPLSSLALELGERGRGQLGNGGAAVFTAAVWNSAWVLLPFLFYRFFFFLREAGSARFIGVVSELSLELSVDCDSSFGSCTAATLRGLFPTNAAP